MSIKNFDDKSIPAGITQSTATSTVNLTGAFTGSITLEFSKSGNIATLFIPQAVGLETGLGGIASGPIVFPDGFVPSALPNVDNNVSGIINLSINNNPLTRSGYIQISNGILSIGGFPATGTTINYIRLTNGVMIPYICS